jgi:hypothetical protein
MHQRFILSLLAATIMTCTAAAQPLIEQVPDNAWLYAGWAGIDQMGDAYAASKFKAVLEATQIGRLIDESLPKLAALEDVDPEGQQAMELVSLFAQATWHHPTAFFITDAVRPISHGEWTPKLALLWKAGPQAQELHDKLATVIRDRSAQPGNDSPPLRALLTGDVVALAVGYDEGEAVLAGGNNNLTNDAEFKAAMGQVKPAAAAVVFIKSQRLLKMIDAGIALGSDPQAKTRWPAVRDALGLTSMRSAIGSAGFDQGDWVWNLFIDAPAPRRGLIAALLDGAALDQNALNLVPRTATWLNAFTFDAPQLLALVRDLLAQVDPQARGEFEETLAKGSAQAGVNLETDLIAALGRTWLLYSDPAVTGFGGLGVCLVHPLRDAGKVEMALSKLETLANQAMADEAHQGGPRFQFQTVQQNGVTIHSLQFPMVAPSWAVSEGNLYVGLYPQAVSTAGFYARDGKSTILANEKFVKLMKELAPPAEGPHGAQLTALSFTDLPQTAPAAYQMYLMITQTITGMINAQGGQAPVMLLPPLGAIMPYLEPAGSFSWVDPSGFHQRGRTPFPGASLLSPEGSMNGVSAPLAVGIMLPALGSARRTARQMQANTQARGIHQAQVVYAQSNNNKFSNDIAALFEGNYFTVEYTLSPVHHQEAPADFDQWPVDQQKQWVRENAAFILVPDLTDDMDTNKIAVFGDPTMFGGRGIPVAYNDNHCNYEIDIEAIKAQLLKQTGKTMEQLIARQREFKE